MTLPTVETLTYNGITFNSYTRTSITVRPVPSPDQRVVEANEYELTATSYVHGTDENSTSLTLSDIRDRLTQPGGQLTFKGMGFDDLTVNVNTVRDVAYGPWPQMLSWTPFGPQCALVTWKVKTTIPEGTGSPRYKGTPMSCAYTVTFTIDDLGLTEVNYSGTMTIPATRRSVNNYDVPDNVDGYRDRIAPDVITGFQRVRQSYQISPDRRTLTFNVTDKELPEAYPDGVAAIRLNHRVATRDKKNRLIWVSTLSGSLSMAAGVEKEKVMEKIQRIAADRIGPGGQLMTSRWGGKAFCVMESMEFSDDVLTRGASFSITYVIFNATVDTVIGTSRMFKGLAFANHAAWERSMANGPLNERGFANLEHRTIDDNIVCLQTGTQPTVRVNQPRRFPPGKTKDVDKNPFGVPVEASWMDWRCRVDLYEDTRTAIHRPLGGGTNIQATANALGALGPILTGTTAGLIAGVAPAANSIAANMSTPTGPAYKVVMAGKALRLGHAIPIPEITDFGGIIFRLDKREVWVDVPGGLAGIPIHRAAWRLTYILATKPNKPLLAPANPVAQFSAGGED